MASRLLQQHYRFHRRSAHETREPSARFAAPGSLLTLTSLDPIAHLQANVAAYLRRRAVRRGAPSSAPAPTLSPRGLTHESIRWRAALSRCQVPASTCGL